MTTTTTTITKYDWTDIKKTVHESGLLTEFEAPKQFGKAKFCLSKKMVAFQTPDRWTAPFGIGRFEDKKANPTAAAAAPATSDADTEKYSLQIAVKDESSPFVKFIEDVDKTVLDLVLNNIEYYFGAQSGSLEARRSAITHGFVPSLRDSGKVSKAGDPYPRSFKAHTDLTKIRLFNPQGKLISNTANPAGNIALVKSWSQVTTLVKLTGVWIVSSKNWGIKYALQQAVVYEPESLISDECMLPIEAAAAPVAPAAAADYELDLDDNGEEIHVAKRVKA